MNKRILFIFMAIILLIFTYIFLQKNNYSSYLLIKAEEYCYKLNKYGNSKEINYNEFIKTNNNIYSIANCFESYIDHDKNEVLNKINQENCDKFLESNKDSNLSNIISEISMLKHELIDVKIIYTEKGNYYVSTYLNTNWVCPSDLYIYDKNTKKLKLIFETYNELILDVNEKTIIG